MLLAYNLTAAPLLLSVAVPPRALPASSSPPERGPAVDLTSELRPSLVVDPAHGVAGGLSAANYATLQALVLAGSVLFEWSSEPEYLTPGLDALSPAESAVADLTVADLAALAALDDTFSPDGRIVAVASLRDDFDLVRGCASASDGITVVSALSGTAKWVRRGKGSLFWARQTAWYIDPAAGDDEAPGAVTAPIKTWAEYQRRVGAKTVVTDINVVVHLLDDAPSSDTVALDITTEGSGTWKLTGEKTVIATSTVVSFSANYAGNSSCLLAITGFDAAGNVGNFIRFPDAFAPGVDAWAIVAGDLGNGVGGVFTVTEPISIDPFQWPYIHSPAPTDAVEVFSVPSMALADLSVRGNVYIWGGTQQAVIVEQVFFPVSWVTPGYPNSTTFSTPPKGLTLQNCRVIGPVLTSSPFFANCLCDFINSNGAVVSFQGGMIGAANITNSVWDVSGSLLITTTPVQSPGIFAYGSVLGFWDGLGFISIGGASYLTFDSNTLLTVYGYLYGNAGGSTRFVRLKGRSRLFYMTGYLVFTNPAVIQVDERTPTWAITELPYVAAETGTGAYDLSSPKAVSGKGPIVVGGKGAVPNGTNYALPDLTLSATDVMPTLVVGSNGLLQNLRFYAGTAAGGVTVTVTVMVNGVASTLTCNTTGGQTASDTTHFVKVKAGDRISFRVVASNVGYSDLSIATEIV